MEENNAKRKNISSEFPKDRTVSFWLSPSNEIRYQEIQKFIDSSPTKTHLHLDLEVNVAVIGKKFIKAAKMTLDCNICI
jgi:hypothetical protein